MENQFLKSLIFYFKVFAKHKKDIFHNGCNQVVLILLSSV